MKLEKSWWPKTGGAVHETSVYFWTLNEDQHPNLAEAQL
jgi:hypothetical protein